MAQVFHLHGGSVLLDHLAAAGIAGERLEWCDPVAFGPTPRAALADATDKADAADAADQTNQTNQTNQINQINNDRWYAVRAAYLASGRGAPDPAAVEARLRAQDAALAAIPAGSEVVVWVGPELFCQALLMRLLVLLAPRRRELRLFLVDPGDQPGDKGCGLGNLPVERLRDLLAARVPVTAEMFAVAVRAWEAFTAPSARPLVDLVTQDPDLGALPHLGPALERHLEDLPDGALGLSTTEVRLLQALEAGPRDEPSLFAALAAREARPFLTDTMLDELVRRLARTDRAGGGPLLERTADQIAITSRGRDVIAGYEVWYAERWHGGIHIGVDEEVN